MQAREGVPLFSRSFHWHVFIAGAMAYEFDVSSKAFGLFNGPEANLGTVPIGVEAQKCIHGCFK